jgi:hypothetical protein
MKWASVREAILGAGAFTTTGDCASSDHGYGKLITFAFPDGVHRLNTITNFFRAP